MMTEPALRNSKSIKVAIGFGVLYGVVCQLFIRAKMAEALYGAMSFGFVFVLPFILGFVTLWYAGERERRSWLFMIFAPWATIAVSLVVALIVGWEGAICMIMAAIVYMPLASVGGIISGLILSYYDRKKLQTSVLAPLLALPILSSYFESFFELPVINTGAETEIAITAPPEVVWQNIIRVPRITEPLSGFFYKMGFPKPVEATLSHEGLGGVRNADFERGLRFIETVDVWEPEKKLSFRIKTSPDSVPPTTLDQHVVVGGRYFDVLRGTYEIEPRADGVVLRLSSGFRVSTRFNFYAGMWAEFLMRDIQQTILEVIKKRCEVEAARVAAAKDGGTG